MCASECLTGDIVWKFDEDQDYQAYDSAGKLQDHISGYSRRVPGVEGNAIELDGYTTHIVRKAKAVPRLGNAFTVSAWIALNTYPWNWVPITDQSEDQQIGYFFGIDAFGHIGFDVVVDGIWRELVARKRLPLKKWAHVTAVFDGASGLGIFINGDSAGHLNTPGTFWQACAADLYVGQIRVPERPFPAWISHPQDPITYSIDGDLDDLVVLNHAVSQQEDKAAVSATHAPQNEVIPYAVLPSGPPGVRHTKIYSFVGPVEADRPGFRCCRTFRPFPYAAGLLAGNQLHSRMGNGKRKMVHG